MSSREKERLSPTGLIYEMFLRRKSREKREGEKRGKREDPTLDLYRRYCKGKKRGKVPKEIEEAVALLGWDIDPGCIPTAATTLATIVTVGLFFLIPLFGLYLVIFEGIGWGDLIPYIVSEIQFGNLFIIFLLLLPFIGFLATYFYLYYYPLSLRDRMLKEMLPTLPETIGYLILSMKLTPNLEKALEFAGENGTGRLAEEFRKLLWEIRMGFHTSTEEAVDRLGYKWGKFLEEVKHALMRIRGAVLEPDEARRNYRLDEALKVVMTGVKERMENLASKMYMPSIQLFYLGVFLPLLLFIILPVASAFSDIPATAPVLSLIYLILLPLITFSFARSILERRPSFYEPPVPPKDLIEDYDKRFHRALLLSMIVALVIGGMGYLAHQILDLDYDKAEILYCGSPGCLLSKEGYASWDEALNNPEIASIMSAYDTTPYWLVYSIIFAVVAAAGLFLYLIESPRIELQRKFEEMEGEFKDTVYLLASRMGEGKPLEGALDSLLEFMPEATIVKEVFTKVSYNIKVLGLSLRDAVFDELFGALRDVPSTFLKRAMAIVVKAVELGTEVASKALLAYSEQLKYEEDIVRALKSKMSEIYTMMMAMSVLVGPVVLGITVALQRVITKSLLSVQVPEVPQELALQMGINMPNIQMKTAKVASPTEFLVIVFLYNLILTALLTYYAVRLYEGKNRPKILLAIGKNLIISSLLFILSSWISITLVRGMIG